MGFFYVCIIDKVWRDVLWICNCFELDLYVSVIISNGKLGLFIIYKKKNFYIDIYFKIRLFKIILILFIVLIICWILYGMNLMISNMVGLYGCVWNIIFVWIGFVKCVINLIIYFIYILKFCEVCVEYILIMFKFFLKFKVFIRRRVNFVVIYEYCEKIGIVGSK